jgi:uncharacterized protein YkwD
MIFKTTILRSLLLTSLVFIMNSCSADSATDTSNSSIASNSAESNSLVSKIYVYNTPEIETLNIINDYRVSVGLNPLKEISYISYKSEEHNDYMIANNSVSHNNFVARSEDIIKVLKAKTVGENLAYNFKTPEDVLKAWLNSPAHKENIVGNYTHFGISIKENPVTGKKYYTNIFVKI